MSLLERLRRRRWALILLAALLVTAFIYAGFVAHVWREPDGVIKVVNGRAEPIIVQLASESENGWLIPPTTWGPGLYRPFGSQLWIYAADCTLLAQEELGGSFSLAILVEDSGVTHPIQLYGDDPPAELRPGRGCPAAATEASLK